MTLYQRVITMIFSAISFLQKTIFKRDERITPPVSSAYSAYISSDPSSAFRFPSVIYPLPLKRKGVST